MAQAAPQRVGKITDWTVPDNEKAPISCKVGGQWVKFWRFQTQEGMEVEHPVKALMREAMDNGKPVLVVGEEDKNTYTAKNGPKKGQEVSSRQFMAYDATLDIPAGATHVFVLDKEGDPLPDGVQPASSMSNGSQADSEPTFKGREPGVFDKTTMARWAISAAIDAKAAGISVDDELLANAAQLFVAQLELAKEKSEVKEPLL